MAKILHYASSVEVVRIPWQDVIAVVVVIAMVGVVITWALTAASVQ